MITLKNDKLTVKINELGAEIKSVYAFDREYIREGKDEVRGGFHSVAFSHMRRFKRG